MLMGLSPDLRSQLGGLLAGIAHSVGNVLPIRGVTSDAGRAEKFKVEESAAAELATSPVLDVLRRSHLVPWIEVRLARLDEAMDRAMRRVLRPSRPERPARRVLDGVLTALLWMAVGLLVLRGAVFVVTGVSAREGLWVLWLGMCTLLRVAVVVALAALVWTPIGTWIGMSPRVAGSRSRWSRSWRRSPRTFSSRSSPSSSFGSGGASTGGVGC